jgi:hypothetical protein
VRYVIVAKGAEGDELYFAGDSFKPNLLLAARFRTEDDARRRLDKSVHCRRILETGALLRVVKIGEK